MEDFVKRAAWTSWGHEYVKDIESFIKTWDYKGCSEFKMGVVKFDWSPRRTRSRGGLYQQKGVWVPGISIAMTRYTNTSEDIYRWYEYKSFNEDPIIGGFYSNNRMHRVEAVIIHEMAHAIQFWHSYYNKLTTPKGHGDEFKKYYAILRNTFLNYKLPDQQEVGRQYRELKKIAVTQELGPYRLAAF